MADRRAAGPPRGGHAQPLEGSDDHSLALAQTHPLQNRIPMWQLWRDRYPVRAQPLARRILQLAGAEAVQAGSKPKVQADQEAWHVLRPSVSHTKLL